MRISKLYLVVCAAALGAGVVTVRADDNPAQAAARAALEEKLRELNAQPASTNTQPAAPATSEQAPPVVVTPSGAAMQPTNPPPATSTMPATLPTAPAKPSPDHGLFGPVPPPSGSAPPESMTAPTTGNPAPPPEMVQPEKGPTQNGNPSYPGKVLGFKPIQPPSLPISAQQQAELQTLLQKYEANQITPEEYQAERQKILAEPD